MSSDKDPDALYAVTRRWDDEDGIEHRETVTMSKEELDNAHQSGDLGGITRVARIDE